MAYRVLGVGGLLAIAFLFGCGGKTPPPIVLAEGTILIDKMPLNKVEVRFIPVDEYGTEYTAKGVTDERGHYKLTTKGQPGACACKCFVVVVEPDLPKELLGENPRTQAELQRYLQSLGNRPLPRKYGNIAQTPLRATVAVDRKDYDFQLERD